MAQLGPPSHGRGSGHRLVGLGEQQRGRAQNGATVPNVYDGRVEPRRFFPPWLRRGVEAGAFGAVLSGGTLLAFHLSRPAPRVALPQGIDGSLILVPALLALGVLAVGMPIFMAATRTEAILGALAGFLVAADLLMAVSFVSRDSIAVHWLLRSMPLGVVSAALAIPVAAAGIAAGPLISRHGFGHTAGLRAVLAAAVVALVMALVGPYAG